MYQNVLWVIYQPIHSSIQCLWCTLTWIGNPQFIILTFALFAFFLEIWNVIYFEVMTRVSTSFTILAKYNLMCLNSKLDLTLLYSVKVLVIWSSHYIVMPVFFPVFAFTCNDYEKFTRFGSCWIFLIKRVIVLFDDVRREVLLVIFEIVFNAIKKRVNFPGLQKPPLKLLIHQIMHLLEPLHFNHFSSWVLRLRTKSELWWRV